MLDEAEFSFVHDAYSIGVRAIKNYRQQHGVSLQETPVEELHSPVREVYEELTGATGFGADQIMKHRLALYGPPCSNCGKPLRTPQAKLCAACGARRAA
jgi:hypothetical protein